MHALCLRRKLTFRTFDARLLRIKLRLDGNRFSSKIGNRSRQLIFQLIGCRLTARQLHFYSFYSIHRSGNLTAHCASDSTCLYPVGLQVRLAIGHYRNLALHLDALTTQLGYVYSCRRHNLTVPHVDALYLSQLTTYVRRRYFLGCDRCLAILLVSLLSFLLNILPVRSVSKVRPKAHRVSSDRMFSK